MEFNKEQFQLKQERLKCLLLSHCNLEGREKDSSASAAIFNCLGLLYKTKTPDKIALIQSAALLNAAIARQPHVGEYQNNLVNLCNHLLNCANAKLQEENLVDFSQTVGNEVQKMRENVKLQLSNIEKITEDTKNRKRPSKEENYIANIKRLQLDVSAQYKSIMAFISRKCVDILGEVPCQYSLVGMGSLARDEITPYSDFEHLIITQNQPIGLGTSKQKITEILEYFRWYSVIFHFIVLNLQETILPSVCIPCLNDHQTADGNWFYDGITLSGISFDGMMPHACKFPLGRTQKTKKKPWMTELIKPVDDMVRYLQVEEDLKNGYKLGDILTKTCFVEGNKELYQQFLKKVQERMRKNASKSGLFKMQLEEDCKNFDIIVNLSSPEFQKKITVKKLYRSVTLFITALGRQHCLKKNSCFQITSELRRQKKISKFIADRLSHAVAVACHMRMFHYTSKNKQDDAIHHGSVCSGEAKFDHLVNCVHENCLAKCLSTAFFLQLMVKRNIDISKYDKTLTEIDDWSHIKFLNLLGFSNKAVDFGEHWLKNRYSFGDEEVNVLHDLSLAYCNSGRSDKSLKLFLETDKLMSLTQRKDMDPHSFMIKRMNWNQEIEELIDFFFNLVLRAMVLDIFIFIVLHKIFKYVGLI